jgi:hypothetical protein
MVLIELFQFAGTVHVVPLVSVTDPDPPAAPLLSTGATQGIILNPR